MNLDGLSKYMTEDEIDQIIALESAFTSKGTEESKRVLASLGWFLFDMYNNREEELKPSHFEKFKSENFWNCLYESFAEPWKKAFIDFIEDKCEPGIIRSYMDFKFEAFHDTVDKKFEPSPKKALTWLTKFNWKGQTLAKIHTKHKEENETILRITFDINNYYGTEYDNFSLIESNLEEDLL